jgi:hypothetical protein
MCGSFSRGYRLCHQQGEVCVWRTRGGISGAGVSPIAGVSPLAAINDHPRPTTVKELQGSTFTAVLPPLPSASFADQLKSRPKLTAVIP